MADDVADIAIRARLDDFERDMRKIPGISEKEIRSASRAMAKAWKMPDPDPGRAFEAKLGKLRQGAGAVFGGIVNDLDDVGSALAALPPIAGAAAVGIGAVAAVGTGLYKATAATGQLKEENAALSAEIDKLTDRAGNLMPQAFETGTIALAAFIATMGDAVTGARAVINVTSEVYDEFTTQAAISIGMVSSALGDNQAAQAGWAEAYRSSRGYGGAIEDGIEQTQQWMDKVGEVNLVLKDFSDTQVPEWLARPEEETIVERVARQEREREAARAKYAEAQARRADEEQAQREAMQAWEDDVFRLQANNIGEIDRARAESLAKEEEIAQHRQDLIAQIATANAAAADAAEADAQRTRDAYLTAANSALDALGQVARMMAEREGQSKAAASAWMGVEKASGVAAIGVNTAVAITKALAELGPVAGAVAAGAIGLTGGVQAAAVLAQPQSFHIGTGSYSPDEGLAKLTRNEGVLTGPGVRAVGGEDAVRRANRGERVAQGPQVIVSVVGHRALEAVMSDAVGMRSSSIHRALKRGSRVGQRIRKVR